MRKRFISDAQAADVKRKVRKLVFERPIGVQKEFRQYFGGEPHAKCTRGNQKVPGLNVL